MEEKIKRLTEFLGEQDEPVGVLSISYNAEDGTWALGMEWGQEEPDNPENDMFGAAAYSTGTNLDEALADLMLEAGIQ